MVVERSQICNLGKKIHTAPIYGEQVKDPSELSPEMKYRAKKCAAPNRTIDKIIVVCHDKKKSEKNHRCLHPESRYFLVEVSKSSKFGP